MKAFCKKLHVWVVVGLMIGLNANSQAAPPDAPFKKVKIDKHPEDVLVKYGESAEFSVQVSHKPVTYQWLHNLVPMPGKTGPTLKIDKVATSDLGNYTCFVSAQHDKEYE
ncbi:MAG: immunoglobulin domain-containing protein, partial [Verrucomicrobia subdivision 3 bacterium]|nr:immunoglobulin domain-containing protein [Limisphaerales bacterium]